MNLYFAPLEGVTGYIFRNIHREMFGGLDKYYAPFVSPTVNPCFKGKEIRDLLPENNDENVNLIPQILTNNAEYFIKAAKQLMGLGYTKEFNLNTGCPSGTVVAKNKGAGFLRDLNGMERFFEELFTWRDQLENGPEISVKTRIGVYSEDEFPQILDVYNKYPISELTVHSRTRAQMYKEKPNLDAFLYATAHSTNPVVYNGDIRIVEDYQKIIRICSGLSGDGGEPVENKISEQDKKPGLAGVMFGRGLIANPNLVNEIRGEAHITKEQIRAYHDRLYEAYEKEMRAEKHLLFKMKEFWNYISWNFVDEHKCAKMIRKCQNLYKYHLAVEEIFNMMTII